MNKGLLIFIATAGSALLLAAPALAKMSTIEEEQYHETTQAAQTLAKSKDWTQALAKYGEAQAQANKGLDKKKELSTLVAIGTIYLDRADYPAAEASFRSALTIAEANPETGDGRLATCLYNLSNVLLREKRDSEARPYFARCIEVSQKVFSADHPVLAVRTSEYASLLSKLGDQVDGTKLANQSSAIINNFMADMSRKIKKAWQPPPENFSYRMTVGYEVLDHGKVGSVDVTQSSGSPTADKAAIDAVKAGAPFGDITSTDADEKLFLDFNFDYNYHHAPKGSTAANQPSPAHATSRHQSREVQEESEVKLKEEKDKSNKLKEEIAAAIKTSPNDATGLAALYVQYSESLSVQGQASEAVSQLRDALGKDCFKGQENTPCISLLIALGHTFMVAPDLGNAEATLKKAIDAKTFSDVPGQLQKQGLEDYGNCLSKTNRFAEAQDYYNRARELKP